jgi:hypothetical protein
LEDALLLLLGALVGFLLGRLEFRLRKRQEHEVLTRKIITSAEEPFRHLRSLSQAFRHALDEDQEGAVLSNFFSGYVPLPQPAWERLEESLREVHHLDQATASSWSRFERVYRRLERHHRNIQGLVGRDAGAVSGKAVVYRDCLTEVNEVLRSALDLTAKHAPKDSRAAVRGMISE